MSYRDEEEPYPLAVHARRLAARQLAKGLRLDAVLDIRELLAGTTAAQKEELHARVERILRGLARLLTAYEIDLCPQCSAVSEQLMQGGERCTNPECRWQMPAW